jgi:hypothetical protein
MRSLGILWVVYGVLRLATTLGMFLWSGTLTLMWGALLSRVPHPFALMDYFHAFLILAIILGTATGIIAILAGLSLMSSGGSARKLGIVAAIFGLIGGPLGIALGAYTLVVLVPGGDRSAAAR